MRKIYSKIFVLGVAVVIVGWIPACRKGPTDFTITSLVAGIVNLTALQPADSVPVIGEIVATFNAEVDEGTTVSPDIVLVQEYNQAEIPISIAVAEKTMSITPVQSLGSGTVYKLIFGTGLKSQGGVALGKVTYTFTTIGTFVPGGAVAYWNLNGNANDQIGNKNPKANGIVGISYAPARNAQAGKAAVFDGTTSIIEIPDSEFLLNSSDFSLGFWIKTSSINHVDLQGKPTGYYPLGLAAHLGFQFEVSSDFSFCKFVGQFDMGNGRSNTQDILFLGDGKTRENGGWQGYEFCRDLTSKGGVAALLKDKWAQVVCMYSSSTNSAVLYINGEKMMVVNFNLWPEGNAARNIIGMKYAGKLPGTANELAFGFLQSRTGTLFANDPKKDYQFPNADHYKGMLDDIMIFHRVLSETEIQLLYYSGN